MNTTRLSTAIALSIALVSPAGFAKDANTKTDWKSVATVTGSIAVGALVGGPVGMVLGGIGGGLYDEQSNQKDLANKKLQYAEEEIAVLETQTSTQQLALIELENKVAKKLEFQVMFTTGVDALTFEDQQRIESLSNYLKENTHLRVRLDGHADPRGTDEYNNVLSSERAKSVAAELEKHGIDKSRIDIYAHGASKTATDIQNSDTYAFARRVNIEVFAQPGAMVSAN